MITPPRRPGALVAWPRRSSPLSVDTFDRLWWWLGASLHVLTLVLLIVVLLADAASVGLVVFTLAYAAGLWIRPRWAWLALVWACWAFLAATSPQASFLAFPLFFLAVGILRPAAGIAVVALTCASAVYFINRDTGISVGGVVGPMVGAVVATVLGLGFRQLRAQAEARSDASRTAGEMAERARIAGDVHDTIAQGLSSIHMLLNSAERRLTSDPELGADSPRFAQALADIRMARDVALDNLSETRRIIAALQPAPLVGTDLPIALARVCRTTPLGDIIEFSVDGTPRPIPAEMEDHVLRITQSLVSNVVRHSHATRARVTLTYQEDAVLLDVVDNGDGFDASTTAWAEPGPTVGLRGVATRVHRLGGDWGIDTAPGQGTGVNVHLPAPPVAEETEGDDEGASR